MIERITFRLWQLCGAGLGGGPIGLLWSYIDYRADRLIEWRLDLFIALTIIGILSGLFAMCLEDRLDTMNEEEWL